MPKIKSTKIDIDTELCNIISELNKENIKKLVRLSSEILKDQQQGS